MQKNVASQKVIVYAYNKLTGVMVASDSGNFSKTVSKDGAGVVSGGGSFTEIAGGFYAYAPTTAETNCDLFLLQTTSSTANVVIDEVIIYTRVGDSIITKLDVVDGIVDSILVDTGTTLDGKIDVIDGIVDSILVDTGTTLDGKIDAILVDTSLTLDGKIDTIDGIVDAILVDTSTTLDALLRSILTDTGTTLDGKLDVIDGIVDSILVDTGTTLPATLVLHKNNIDAILLDTIALTDGTIIDGKTITQALQIIAAAVSGRVSGAGTGTETFLGMDEATTRITVTVDSDGNRSDIVYG